MLAVVTAGSGVLSEAADPAASFADVPKGFEPASCAKCPDHSCTSPTLHDDVGGSTTIGIAGVICLPHSRGVTRLCRCDTSISSATLCMYRDVLLIVPCYLKTAVIWGRYSWLEHRSMRREDVPFIRPMRT